MKADDNQDMTADELQHFEEEMLHEDSHADDSGPASDTEIAKERVPQERPLNVPPIAPD
jgi:hypothetical protein